MPGISAQLIQQRLYGSDALTMLRLVRRSKELVSAWRRFRQIIEASRNNPRCILTRSLVERHLAHVESELLRVTLLCSTLHGPQRHAASRRSKLLRGLIA